MVHQSYIDLEENPIPLELGDDLGERLYQRAKKFSPRSKDTFGTFLILYFLEEDQTIVVDAKLYPSGHHEVTETIEAGWKGYVETYAPGRFPTHLVTESLLRVI